MELEIVFNELSLQSPAADINTAKQWMTEFIKTILAIKPPSNVKRKLRTKSDFQDLLLAPDYPIYKWRKDPDVDIEAQRLIRSLQDKNDPPLPDIADPEIQVIYQGQDTIGIYYAYVYNSLAISLQSEPQWEASSLEVQVTKINEDEEEQLITTNESVIHASCSNHVKEHAVRLKINVLNGSELWNRREELFPNLEFCKSGNKQLRELLTGDDKLATVMQKLEIIQQCAQNWKTGFFSLDGYAIEESGESESTMNQYWRERTFMCPDGQERTFERHAKLKDCNWRIYFLPTLETKDLETKNKKVIIGYVGTHLLY
jgi:hypothetical protein